MNYAKSVLTIAILIALFATSTNAQRVGDKGFEEYLAGRAYFAQYDYTRAVDAFNRSIALKPSTDAYKFLGMAYHHLDKYDQALVALTQAARGAPNDPEVHYWLAWTYESIGIQNLNAGSTDLTLFRKAEVEAREALRLRPNYQLAYSVLADSLYKQAKYRESVAAGERALALRVDDQATMYLLALGYARVGRKPEAMQLYNRLVPLDPKYAASLLSRLNEISNNAAATSTRPNSSSPPSTGSADYYLNEGVKYYKVDQYARALPALQQAIKLDPTDSSKHFWLGATYHQLKRYQLAVASLQEAIRLKPNDAYSHHWLGDVYAEGFKQYEKAISEYEESIRLDPQYAIPRNQLGLAYTEIDELELALSAFQGAIKIKPAEPLYYQNLGYTYLWLGRREDAVVVQQKLLTLDQAKAKELSDSIDKTFPADKAQDNAEFLLTLGQVVADRPNTSLIVLRRALLLSTAPEGKATAHLGMGDAYKKKGNTRKAIASYQQALSMYQRLIRLKPNDGSLLHGLGFTYLGLNQREQAVAIQRKLQTIDPELAKDLLDAINKPR